MSKEISELRKQEIEKMIVEEEQMAKEMENDTCCYCGKPTKTFEYITFFPQMGWLECPGCGNVFCPNSIRKRKIDKMNQTNHPIVAP